MIFTLPAKPNVAATTASTSVNANLAIAAGTSIDYEGAQAGYQPAYYVYAGNLSVAGFIWAQDAEVFNFQATADLNNSGTIVSDSNSYQAVAAYAPATLENSGAIYAISQADNAFAVPEAGFVTNTGLIAAYSKTSYATGINSETLSNSASGRILAEGIIPTAVETFTLTNYGLVEAVSDGSNASIGVSLAGVNARIDNYGTITGTDAVYSDTTPVPVSTGQPIPVQIIDNHAGGVLNGSISIGDSVEQVVNAGQINGNVTLGDSNDAIDNTAGQINGNVLLGNGNDTVDNTAGTITGYTQLGDGNDIYYGSTVANDNVLGGRGNDIIIGGTGNDLLIGGRANDVIVGGGGNSGLYGGTGNDLIFTSGGDTVNGEAGNDRIVLADLSFAYVTGGGGDDTLVLPQGSLFLNLHAALATGRIGTFDAIELATGQRLAISAGDATQLAGANQPLYITSQGSGEVDLVGNWAAQGVVAANGVAYDVYAAGSDLVYVASSVNSDVVSTVDPAAQSLAPVAAGATAPALGSQTWAQLPGNNTLVSLYSFNTLTIAAGETWTDTTGDAALAGGESGAAPTLLNYGNVISNATGASGAISAIGVADSADGGTITNDGSITSTFADSAAQLSSEQSGLSTYGLAIALNHTNDVAVNTLGLATITNAGTISARSTSGGAVADFYANLDNTGAVTATSSDFIAAAAFVASTDGGPGRPAVSNSGSISANGLADAVGIYDYTYANSIVNSGTIAATATGVGASAYGIAYYYLTGRATLINSGTITAQTAVGMLLNPNQGVIALLNTGRINGAITFNTAAGANPVYGLQSNVIVNSGTITGQVNLGQTDDIYYGRYGKLAGAVLAGSGNDIIVGSAGGETLTGGSGHDIIVSGGGDTLVAGSGADRFVFLTAASSTAAAPATITGFVSGTDTIDLSALGLASVAIASSGGVSTITGTVAGSQFSLKVKGAVALSDIILGSPAATQNASAGNEMLVAPASGGTLIGDGGSDLLIGSAGNDTLVAGSGPGFSILDGGGGVNTAQFSGDQSGYLINENADGTVLVTNIYNNGLMAPDYELINIQNLQFADATINLSAATVTLNLGSNVLLLQAGQTLNLSNPNREPNYGSSPDTVTGSGGTVNLSQADAAISGSSDAVSVAGANNRVSLTGGSDSLTDNGTGDVLTVGGNGQFAPVADQVSIANGATVTETDGSRVSVSGNGATVNVGNSDLTGITGSSATVNVSGTGDALWIGGDGQYTAAYDTVSLAEGGTITELDNARLAVSGYGGVIDEGNADTLGVTGVEQVVDITGLGSAVWIGGNGQYAAVADFVDLAQGGTVTEFDNSRVAVQGSNATVDIGNSDLAGVLGSSEVVNVNGASSSVWVGANGQFTDAIDSVAFAGMGTANILDYSRVGVTGSGEVVNVGSYDSVGAIGSSETMNVTGASSAVWIGGNGQTTSAIDTIAFAGVGTATIIDNSRVAVSGNGQTVNVGNNDFVGAIGASETVNVTGTNSAVWIGGNGEAASVADTMSFTSGGTANVLVSSKVSVAGNGVNVNLAATDAVALLGQSDTVGLGGSDNLSFATAIGHATIAGFDSSDQITLSKASFGAQANGFDYWAHLLADASVSGGNTTITIDGSDSIVLQNYSLTAANQGQFHFA